jgi:hypothetical protein
MGRASVHGPDATVALRRGLRCRHVESDAAWNRTTQEIEQETILFRRQAGPRRRAVGRDPTIALGDADLLEIRAGHRSAVDPTIALGDADVLEIRAARRESKQSVFVGDSWSIDIVVGDDGGDAYAAAPDDGQSRGLFWRLLVRLGWIKLDEEPRPLGA